MLFVGLKGHVVAFTVLLTMVLFVAVSGCVTQSTVRHAKGKPEINDHGDLIETEPGKPALYALVPFTAGADVALSPGYFLWFLVHYTGPSDVYFHW